MISPKEIDLYFDDYSYGIEFCGITWHGENNNRSEFYHQNKFKEMDSKDMNLVQIFSDDYIRYKDSIVDNIFIDLGICEYVKNYTLEYYDNYDYIEKFIDENRYMIYHYIGKEFLVIKIKNIIIGIISYDDKTIKDIFITKSLKLDNLFEKISNFFQDDIFYEHQISTGNRYFTKNLIKISYTEPLRFYRKKNIRYDYEVESYDDIIWDCGKIIYKKEYDKNDNIKRN